MLQKPIFWIILFFAVVFGILILIFKPSNNFNSSKNPASKLSEKSKPGNCLILEQKYCTQAKLTEVKEKGVTYKYIGFHLPAGIPLFAPMDGSLGKTKMDEPSPVHGFSAIVFNPNDPVLLSFSFYGDIKFDNMITTNVNKGDITGYTQDTGIKGLEDYNIVVTASRLNSNKDGFVTDEELLKRLLLLR